MCEEEEEEEETKWMGCGHSKIFGLVRRIALAWVSVHGSWHRAGKAIEAWNPGINRLDKIAKQHDIDYSHAKNLQDKWKADTKMIKAIDRLPGKRTMTEKIVKKIMQAKTRLKL